MPAASGNEITQVVPTVIVRYRSKEGEVFDWDYYQKAHLNLVRRLLTPHGLISFTIDRPVEVSADAVAVVALEFDDMERLLRGLDAVGHTLAEDVGNFFTGLTDLTIAERTRGR
ncbi:MAG: EthD family reductase [Pseudonocardia sp.]|nr:MAG: EthD family reductase [Pseudonocardia sp.]